MTPFSPNPIILMLQCAFLFAAISIAVYFLMAVIKDINASLPSLIPRRLRLPVWFAAVLLFWRFAPDIFPPVMDFISDRLDSLTRLTLNAFAAEPATACLFIFLAGLFLGTLASAVASLETMSLIIERHRKGMMEEFAALSERCPRRTEDGGHA